MLLSGSTGLRALPLPGPVLLRVAHLVSLDETAEADVLRCAAVGSAARVAGAILLSYAACGVVSESGWREEVHF